MKMMKKEEKKKARLTAAVGAFAVLALAVASASEVLGLMAGAVFMAVYVEEMFRAMKE